MTRGPTRQLVAEVALREVGGARRSPHFAAGGGTGSAMMTRCFEPSGRREACLDPPLGKLGLVTPISHHGLKS